nr:uncharacterized protein LOC116430968 [Nomia melanderi]
MGKVSMAVRSAAMSHIEPRLPTILGRAKMRSKLLKIVVILVLCGSGQARPQKTGESSQPEALKPDEKRPVQSAGTPAHVQDTRYTRNSGNSRIPYANPYYDRFDPFVAEVSADESRPKSPISFNGVRSQNPATSLRDLKIPKNSTFSAAINFEKPVRSNHRMLKIFPEGNQNHPPRLRNFTHKSKGSSLRNFTSLGKSDQTYRFRYESDRSSSSRVSYFIGSKGSNNNVSRRRPEIGLNNSRKGPSLAGDSKFSEVSSGPGAKVEASREFDHVAAIKKITDMLTRQNAAGLHSKDRVPFDRVPQSPPVRTTSTRHPNTKNSNRVKHRHPSNQSKIDQNKLNTKISKIREKSNDTQSQYWKNWPNGEMQTQNDYQNYEKYTSFIEDLNPDQVVKKPVHLGDNGTDHLLPISSPNLQEIVHWLKIPAFMANGSNVLESNEANDPMSAVFDPVYQNLEPNRPLRPESLKPGFIYPLNSKYTTVKPALPNMSSKNKTSSPQTLQDENAVQLNSDSKKPNWTKGPGNSGRPVNPSSSVSSGSLDAESQPSLITLPQLASSTTQKPGPNVHIGFTSSEDKNKLPNQEELRPPLVTYDQRCPTILINSYTRINNTIQSKEGCTDLNIIINSHVFNTNTFKSTPSPSYQTNPGIDQETDKYGSDLSYHSNIEDNFYGPLKDPVASGSQDNVDSNVQVFQGTHISISGSGNDGTSEINEFSDAPSSANDAPAVEGVNQADNDPNVNSVVRPDADVVSDEAFVPSLGSPSSELVASPAPAAVANDDDDDDEYDLSPSGIVESIASVFAYFTFINPLHYGFFSIAAAPFTALAAGILGTVTFLFPWLFPSSFGFSRANNDAIGFWSSVEEIVSQSLEKYVLAKVVVRRPPMEDEKALDRLPHALQNDTQRQLKDLQYMDQSLRTVATQLLNVTSSEDGKPNGNAAKKSGVQKLSERNEIPTKEITVSSGPQSVNVGFGRPVNSKFGFFETSHPGQAMAITEEELEKELSSTRLMTAYKNHPTTTGGISTWVLLNPPSTTIKTIEGEKKTKLPIENEVKATSKPTTIMERIDTTERVMEKVTLPVSTSVSLEEASSTRKPVPTTKKPDQKLERTTESSQITLKPLQNVTVSGNLENKESPVVSTKKIQTIRTTPKPKVAVLKTTVLSKPSILKTSRPNQQNRPKPQLRRTTTVKPDIVKNENASSAKIEKVTFRPVQMITVSKSKPESTEKPMFVTKIKASILMDTQKTTTLPTVFSTGNQDLTTTLRTVSSTSELVETSTKMKTVGTKSNVLKVQLKKPVEDTKIEIEPIKVNTPVLKIEKVEKDESKDETKEDSEKDTLNNSRIDLKFDFNPELTKINVDSETPTSTTRPSSTTKRSRHSSKRKKNKSRRRKPSTTTTTTMVTPLASSTMETDLTTVNPVAENGIQESKIASDTKVSTNATKTKKKPIQKPISTQIYNFLSREVMPSFGVMSLVGLGLGLASYFLYPFGGTIARRNYEVEPKYKYNLDEYGGNYGQSEEEVLSKVFQGMTNEDNKYPGVKDYDNYYQYQHFDGGYDSQTTKKYDQRYSSSPIYRPENTASVLKYRNTDFRYPDVSSTPNYYDNRPKHTEYVVGQSSSANRQFVVGNVPKEYPYEEKILSEATTGKLPSSYEPTESDHVNFKPDINQNFNFPNQNHGQVQTARPEEGYEEVEITPTAVAVEHGPRSLKTKRSVDNPLGSVFLKGLRSRVKRDSVIQIIPSKRELEEEGKEEDLSNEILNIIDSAIPGEDNVKTRRKESEISEELEAKKRRKEEEEEKKESITKSTTVETSEKSSVESSTQETVSSTTLKEADGSLASSSTSSSSSSGVTFESSSTESSKTTEESDAEWMNSTTKKPEEQEGFGLFSFVKKIAEIKLRLGLTLLKHASEGFARYLGHVQKRINGEE